MRNRFLTLALLSTLLALPALPVVAHDMSHELPHAQALTGQSLYNIHAQWTTQDNQTIELSSFRGQPVVAAMIYTSCPDMCPLIVQNMMRIETEVSARPHPPFHFVLISFDPARDTPAQLKEFATAHSLDPKNWTLLRGDKKAVQELAAALGVRYRLTAKGGYDHSNIISLLDAQGVIAYQQQGLGQSQELEQKLAEMVN